MSNVPRFRPDDPEWIKYYRQNGYSVIADAWTPETCDALTHIAYKFTGPARGDFTPLMQPQREDPEFLSALRNRLLVQLIEAVVGGRVSGLQVEFFFGRPGTKGFSPHQDNYYVQGGSDTFLSAWSAFTDIVPKMGGLYVYPGSHRYGLLPVRRIKGGAGANQDPNASSEETILPKDANVSPIVLEAQKGDTIILHGDLVHGSLSNSSDRFRYALLCTYIKKSTPFRAGNYAKRQEIEVH